MSWNPDPTVTINGTNFTGSALNGVSVEYGRSSFWDQPRAANCVINLANLNNSNWAIAINNAVTVKVKNSSGTDVTIFTGTVAEISNSVSTSGTTSTTVNQSIRAVGSFAKMSRVLTGDTTWPKELDSARISRIFTASGLSVDTIDTPGIYEFQSISAPLSDCYSFAAKYAQMAFGYIYETRLGQIGYANESRRNVELATNGHTNIPKNVILGRTVSSYLSVTDITNDVSLTWRSGTETYSSPGSISTYGKYGAVIDTELHNLADATFQASRYGALRAVPQTNLSSFTVQLDATTMTNTLRDKLLTVFIGMGVQVDSLPNGILNGSFTGFVEGHRFTVKENQVSLTLTASDSVYSLTPTRWQDVSATLIWNDVNATLQWQDYD